MDEEAWVEEPLRWSRGPSDLRPRRGALAQTARCSRRTKVLLHAGLYSAPGSRLPLAGIHSSLQRLERVLLEQVLLLSRDGGGKSLCPGPRAAGTGRPEG